MKQLHIVVSADDSTIDILLEVSEEFLRSLRGTDECLCEFVYNLPTQGEIRALAIELAKQALRSNLLVKKPVPQVSVRIDRLPVHVESI